MDSPTDTPRPGLQRRLLIREAGAMRGRTQGRQSPGKTERRRPATRHMVWWTVVQRRAQRHPSGASGTSAQRAGGRGSRGVHSSPPPLSAGDSGRRDTHRAGPSPQRDRRLRHLDAGSGRWASGHCRGGRRGGRGQGAAAPAARGHRGPFARLMITWSPSGLGDWPPVTRAGCSCSLHRVNSLPFCPPRDLSRSPAQHWLHGLGMASFWAGPFPPACSVALSLHHV